MTKKTMPIKKLCLSPKTTAARKNFVSALMISRVITTAKSLTAIQIKTEEARRRASAHTSLFITESSLAVMLTKQ